MGRETCVSAEPTLSGTRHVEEVWSPSFKVLHSAPVHTRLRHCLFPRSLVIGNAGVGHLYCHWRRKHGQGSATAPPIHCGLVSDLQTS